MKTFFRMWVTFLVSCLGFQQREAEIACGGGYALALNPWPLAASR